MNCIAVLLAVFVGFEYGLNVVDKDSKFLNKSLLNFNVEFPNKYYVNTYLKTLICNAKSVNGAQY